MAKPKNIPTIVGPTGVGKTAYALHLAHKINAEIVSADSRQVFIGMDIATGKESDRGNWEIINNRRTLIIHGTPIHALDLATPDQTFSVSQWHDTATKLINEILDRNRVPLVVGGTGFYLDALMGYVQTMNIPPNAQLRAELQKQTRAELQQYLKSFSPERWENMNYSDQNNPARLMRAIEIEAARRQDGKTAVAAPQSSISHLQSLDAKTASPPAHHDEIKESELGSRNSELFMVGLTMPRHQLYAKIDARLDHMLEQGLVDETKQLSEQYGRHPQAMSSLGYTEIARYLDGEINLATAMQMFKHRVHAYARRQYTWFNHRPVHWFDTSQPSWQARADQLIRSSLSSPTSSL